MAPVGRATAARLLAEGREVIVAQRPASPPDLPKRAAFAPCDVLDRDAVGKAMRGAEQFVVAIGFTYSGVVWREAWPKADRQFRRRVHDNRRADGVDRQSLHVRASDGAAGRDHGACRGWFEARRALSCEIRIGMDAPPAKGEALIAALRAPDFYGPGVGNSFLGDTSIGKLAKGKAAIFIGSPAVLHDYAYVPDVARAADGAFGRPGLGVRQGLACALRADALHAGHPRKSRLRRSA